MGSPLRQFLVTGGTGRIGSAVVRRLHESACQVRVLTRGRRPHEPMDGVVFMTGDLTRDMGIEPAVDGADVVVHCAGTAKFANNKVQIRNLTRAAQEAGVRHFVFISVVGADRVPVSSRLDRAMFSYFPTMVELERTVSTGGLPWSILRATQFYDALLLIAQYLAKLPVMPIPAGFRFQPVDTRDVAARLVELALGEPAGMAGNVGGPRIYVIDELLRAYLRATHKRRPMLPVRIPGRAAGAVRDGAILSGDGAVGRRTWEEFLAERFPDSLRSL